MSEHAIRLDWEAPDLVSAYRLFKQKCEMLFSVKVIKKEKQVDHILLMAGDEAIRRYNSWDLAPEEARNPETVWRKFGEQIEPKLNARIERLQLRNFKQNSKTLVNGTVEVESIDDCLQMQVTITKVLLPGRERNERAHH